MRKHDREEVERYVNEAMAKTLVQAQAYADVEITKSENEHQRFASHYSMPLMPEPVRMMHDLPTPQGGGKVVSYRLAIQYEGAPVTCIEPIKKKKGKKK
jgi:hypothetical protein